MILESGKGHFYFFIIKINYIPLSTGVLYTSSHYHNVAASSEKKKQKLAKKQYIFGKSFERKETTQMVNCAKPITRHPAKPQSQLLSVNSKPTSFGQCDNVQYSFRFKLYVVLFFWYIYLLLCICT